MNESRFDAALVNKLVALYLAFKCSFNSLEETTITTFLVLVETIEPVAGCFC